MTYPETIEYLFSTLPMFSRLGGRAIKKTLANIEALCNHLGHPENLFKSVHVGGTNGKGSVSNMLAAVLQQQGYKTGLYTSPHLFDFRERIRVNGIPCTENFVVEFVRSYKSVIEEIQPSFFEITVAMAFRYFAQEKVDIAVIEVGLGGRLDSTNIIAPELSIITNIGLDHTDMLGNTLQEIAGEKAGIIKPNTPVLIGELQSETFPVFQQAAAKASAPLTLAEDVFNVSVLTSDLTQMTTDCLCRSKNHSFTIKSKLSGPHQVKNIRTALAAAALLRDGGIEISQDSLVSGIENVKDITGFWGRMEVLQTQPLVLADVAHNAEGMQTLLQTIANVAYRNLHVVIGLVKDKDADAMLSLLPPLAHYYFTNASIPRALPADELQLLGAKYLLDGAAYQSVGEAVDAALQNAAADDLVVIAGSFFIVAEIDVRRFRLPGK